MQNCLPGMALSVMRRASRGDRGWYKKFKIGGLADLTPVEVLRPVWWCAGWY